MRKVVSSDIDPGRIQCDADESAVIFRGEMKMHGHVIHKIELKRYVERTDDSLGQYSLLTVVLETEKGNVEMKYDEGYRGRDALESATSLLTQYTGLSSLVNRAIIELQASQG